MSSFSKLDRVPPMMPIIWQDWDSSVDIQNMTVAEEGLFFRLLRKLWVLDELPADPWRLAQQLGVRDHRTVARWLEKYSHLTVKTQKHHRDCTVSSLETSCDCPVILRSEKLGNLKNDVILGLPLGTTKPQQNLNRTEPEPLPSVATVRAVSKREPEAGKQPVPEQEPKANPTPNPTDLDGSDASVLTNELLNLSGRREFKNGNNRDESNRAFASLLAKGHTEAFVLTVMRYALTENPVWTRAIKGTKKVSPWLYFCEKFDDIVDSMELDEEFTRKAKSKVAAAMGKEKPAFHNQAPPEGRDWFDKGEESDGAK